MKIFTGILMDDPKFTHELVIFCNQNKVTVLSFIPWVAGEFGDQEGFLKMFQILDAHGGRKVYIPSNRVRFSEKFNISNSNDTIHNRMIKYSDDRGFIDFPSLWGVYVAMRRAAISTALKNGHTKKEIVSLYGTTERGLRNLVN